MATTTPNYGWAVPTSTDLVKDGATAIETLGDAIDASMNTALGTKKAGMVLLNTTSFSAVASQAVTAFSTTYDNYKIIVDITGNSTTADINLKLRSGATDNSADYTQAVTVVSTGGSTTNLSQSALTTGFRINGVHSGSSSTQHSQTSQIDLFRPFLAVWTTHNALIAYRASDGTYYGGAGTGLHAVTTSFDGINLIASAGTITGRIQIFGYNQ
jgi:hypothetical protein